MGPTKLWQIVGQGADELDVVRPCKPDRLLQSSHLAGKPSGSSLEDKQVKLGNTARKDLSAHGNCDAGTQTCIELICQIFWKTARDFDEAASGTSRGAVMC